MPSRLGPWLIALAIGAAAAFAVLWGSGAPAPVGNGSPAPEFTLERLVDGAPVSLSDLRGQVVLVNFWATWCKPCEDEMPAMERLYRALRAEGFELLAISVDRDPDVVSRFRERLGLSFPILLDPERRVARAFLTFRFPESLLIGPDGVVLERYIGAKEWDAEVYVERIRRLLRTGLPSGSAQGAGSAASRWGAREGNPGDPRPARLGAGARRAGRGGRHPVLAASSW
jgi:peroxiredoxin